MGPFYNSDRRGPRRTALAAADAHLRRLSLCRPLGCASGEEARPGSRDLPCLARSDGTWAGDADAVHDEHVIAIVAEQSLDILAS